MSNKKAQKSFKKQKHKISKHKRKGNEAGQSIN
jgi:hypothetical protein